jgi:hypothetical protein
MATEDLKEKVKSEDRGLYDKINKYIDDLKEEAQGDFAFVTKFLKKQFEFALGTDDTARAGFFAKVANTLEERIGRVPYDFEKFTGREKEDIANFLKKKDMEDSEQRKEEIEFRKQQSLASEKEKKQVAQAASSRGMLGSGIQKRQEAEVAEERKVNIVDPKERVFAYRQALRDEDRRLGKIQSERNTEDITSKYRRLGQDTQFDYNRGMEGAERDLSKKLAAIDRTERGEYERGSELIEQNKLDRAFRDQYGV